MVRKNVIGKPSERIRFRVSAFARRVEEVMLHQEEFLAELQEISSIVGKSESSGSDLDQLINDLRNGDGANSLSALHNWFLTLEPKTETAAEAGMQNE